ncbi:hypothetical protein GOP47_0004356 [Adiantum capillus-veneris]|uniref:Uncharacterized protein n=1 Tax=Adiantum capillus-veneris TaxID=13818 RepID=A0A9D4ZMI6_ADICA|nr:hypothetical protein GOP47_0004356 [Adiantum capillus-veneris]
MEDTQKQTVRTLTTAREIWTRLMETYEHKDVASQIINLKNLVNMTMSNDQDTPKFVESW